VPWTAANQFGRDWCALGADVEFHTNEEPPFLNKLVVNHALPMFVDGEPAMQWIAGRFNGQPTTEKLRRILTSRSPWTQRNTLGC